MTLVRLEPAAPRSPVNHSTTEPLQKVQVGMYKQLRFKSGCSSAQSDQYLSFWLEEKLDPLLPIERPLKTDHTAWMHRLI